MNEMYAMTVLGNLGTVLVIIGIFLVLIGALIYGSIMHDEYNESVYDTQEEKEARRRGKIRAKRLLITGFISLLLCCFIPSTKEMYAIYGIGGVIDYVKGNEKAKKLPDKVIDALNKYFDEQEEDK